MCNEKQIKLGTLKMLLEDKTKAELTLKSLKELTHNLNHLSFNLFNSNSDSLSKMEKQVSEELDTINHSIFVVETEIFNLLE